ncbi:hypothetical protein [uncultured Ilumatobacter sp.]|uniref:hypothetical protein n=1 Tax=uncultured Ilumatobacter sp. TaxID=879968 RepID=UPI00374E5B26
MTDDHFDANTDRQGSGRDGLDQLAQRAVDAVLRLVRRASALAGGMLFLATAISAGGFFLGIATLEGGIETVWAVLASGFALIAITSVTTALLRLRSVRSNTNALLIEIRSLITGNTQTQRTVIETIESTEASQEESVVAVSRQFFSLQNEVGNRSGQFKSLGDALTALTSFAGLIALAALITFVFAGLSVIFLIALALP